MSDFKYMTKEEQTQMINKAKDVMKITTADGHTMPAVNSNGQSISTLPAWKLKRGLDKAFHKKGAATLREKLRQKLALRQIEGDA